MKYVLLSVLIAFNSLACPMHTAIKSGQPAPCDGRFLSDKADKKVRDKYSVMEQTVEKQKKQLELKDIAIDAKSKQSDLWKAEANKQSKIVQEHKNDLRNGLILGVGASLLALFLIGNAAR